MFGTLSWFIAVAAEQELFPPSSDVERIGENARKVLFDPRAHQLQVINPPGVALRQNLKNTWAFPIRKYKPNSDYLLFRLFCE